MKSLNFIDKKAKIGNNLKIDNFSSIHNDVVIGDNCKIGSNVTIFPGVNIGSNCHIYPGAVIGGDPQHLHFKDNKTNVLIDDNCIIRECVTINKATKSNEPTTIGKNCYLMAYSHVAHDCILHKNIVVANGVAIAGHVEIQEGAIIGGLAAIQQFTKIGKFSMISGGSLVRKNVPPFIKVAKEPLRFIGINRIGLERAGFENNRIDEISNIYRILFQEGNNTSKAIELITQKSNNSIDKETIVTFIKNSKKGIIKGFY
ncbi:MAG: acyl-[acyl-carrier-protein]--UDP-N-acetylglucosamine O-acyltransferase [Flavobacteriales bacterium]|nr:acyl-[acyl-carrier-protein]--UDP-N-acetylglucosamine O-acyltransferase [Flavobacteriales bacterium]